MMNIKSWAAASAVVAILGACTTETTDNTSDGGTTTTSTTSGAAGSTSSTTSGSGGGGGAGGASDDGGACAVSATAKACEKCSFDKCMAETCACYGNADCKGAVPEFWTCISDADGGAFSDCSTTFSINANGDMVGGGLASTLADCMQDCENTCKGIDAGPRR